MLEPISSTLQEVIYFTLPVVTISVIIMVSFRLCYIVENHQKVVLYKELCMLIFGIYILCLFQIVTFQDGVSVSSNNLIPFKEISRYSISSRLFFKNVLGNMMMFLPFGLFISYYLKSEKITLPLLLTIVASLSIEIVQLSIGRVFDVDDIILNVCGGILGYLFYRLLKRISDKLPNFCRTNWFRNILMILVLFGLVAGIFFILK